MADTEGELLVVLLDTNLLRLDRSSGAPADVVLQQLLLFLKAHQLVSEHNHQCVMALHPGSCPVIYTPAAAASGAAAAALPALLLQRLRHLMAQPAPDGGTPQQQQQQQHRPEVALSAGLSRALCYVRRHSARYGAAGRRAARPRVLSLLAAADTPLQYIPVMNAIFAAQGAGVALDALVVGASDSGFMQQAAHITGGLYARASPPSSALEHLLGAFCTDTATRGLLALGGGSAVDFRASCFCHKSVIDTAWVCSVCLSIFCKANMRLPACPTCGCEFTRGRGGGGAATAAAAAAPAQGAGGGGSGGGTQEAAQPQPQQQQPP